MAAPREIAELVERFERNLEDYRSGRYKETQLRLEFIDPFFEALGWDVHNKRGYAEAYKDVIHEDAIKVGGATKAPDYCFRIGGTRKFFVEAKKPSVSIKDAVHPAYQLRRYAWSAKLPLSILTDFEEFAAYDCRIKPSGTDKASAARTIYVPFTEYPQRWDEIASIFSREEVLKGSFDKYAESTKRKKGTAEVDSAFLQEIEVWRDSLARNIALRNPQLSQRELNFAVQRTIDRIIFLRICEDRGVEHYGQLQALLNGTNVYPRLCQLFYRADERYNSGLFYFRKEKARPDAPDELTPGLAIDDKALKEIIARLYYPESPYEFSVLPADILGQVYEQFLGKVIRLTAGHRAVVEDKPEVRKAGGVYYTPTYIVDYIVRNTVGRLLEGSGVRDQGSGCGVSGSGKGDGNYGAEDVSRSPGLAKGDGPGRSGLQDDGGLSGEGEVRADQPDSEGGGLHSGQHRGGLRQDSPGGLSSSSFDCERIPDGGGNVSDVGGASEVCQQGASSGGLEPDRTSGQNADETHRLSEASPNPKPDTLNPDSQTRNPIPQTLTPKEAAKLRILDPACGSGSFLIGAYQYLLDWHLNWYTSHNPEKWARKKTPPIYETRTSYPPNPKPQTPHPTPPSPSYRLTTSERKRILLNNIYGVDIDAQAVEVTKLSLLLKVLEGENEETLERQLKFFHERALPDLGSNIKCGNSLIGPDFYDSARAEQMTFLDEEERYRINAFDWNAEFPEIMKSGGFDAVIGNPPWGGEFSQEEKRYLRNKYEEVHVRTPESFNYFVKRMWDCTGQLGLVGLIIPSSFLNQSEFCKTRKLIVESRSLCRVCNLGTAVFQKVTAPCCIIVFARRGGEGKPIYLDLRRVNRPDVPMHLLEERGGREAWGIGTQSDSFVLQIRAGVGIIHKCCVWPKLRQVAADVATGVSSGLDAAYVYAADDIKRLGLEPALLRKLVIGGEIKRYALTPMSGKHIMYVTRDTSIEQFPNSHAALLAHRERLKKRVETASGLVPWFSLYRPRRKKLFEEPKILIRQTADRILAAFDAGGWYCLKSGIIVQLNPDSSMAYQYLLGLLNSRLMRFLYDDLVAEQGRVFPEVKPVQLFRLPIRTIDPTEADDRVRHDRMAELVERMVELHKRLAPAKTAHEKTVLQREIETTDRQIDQLVYELYGLTEEEIKIVEGGTHG